MEHDDPCWFFFTSGTTGRPKAAVLTHGQMAFVITNHLCDLMPGTTEQDVSLAVAPLSHGAGIHLLTQVARAACTVLPASTRFDAEEIWQLVERHRVSNMFTVPTIVKMLVEHPAVDAWDHSSLRYVIYAGAPMYREDQKRALEKLGPVLVQYFGLGEVTGNITVLPPALHEAADAPGARLGTAASSAPACRSASRTTAAGSWTPASRARSASAVRRCSRATTPIRRPTKRPSVTAGSAPGTWAIWMRRASSISPAGNPICTSRAARTSIRARSRKRC